MTANVFRLSENRDNFYKNAGRVGNSTACLFASPPLGKEIRVDSIKIANEVRAHAGTRR